MSEFKNKLKELRKEKGISQKQLATAIRYGQSTICDWEKGRIEPTANALISVADFFDVTIDELVRDKNY